jgi:rfaE bifunctional protein kinase chain/domain
MVEDKYKAKIKTARQVRDLIGPRPRAKKVIMCHGAFDVVHPGHIRHLMYAREKADLLIASLTSDAHIQKANVRPYIPENLRALNLAAMEMVDYVIIDPDPTPLQNLALVQPDYYAKGYEYNASGLHPRTKEEKDVLDSYGGEIIFTPGDIIYSSSAILKLEPPRIHAEKLQSLLDAEGLQFSALERSLDKFKGTRVHVIGDTIVDSYTETTMIGGQTKTPTMSVRYERQRDFVGGAGIVAKHLKAAGADVVFSTVLGRDALRDFVLEDLRAAGVTVREVVDETRPTTNKNAIVCENYRLLKIDTLDNRSISGRVLDELTDSVATVSADMVMLCDFRHGIFNATTIPRLIDAIPQGVFRVADSQVASRWGNILDFQGFDLITPNEREARFALGDQDSVIRPLAQRLYESAKCKHLIMKLGERGLLGYRPRADITDVRSFFIVDSFADHVVDAVGAGDALLAYAALSMVTLGEPLIAAVLGSMAAAVECELDGNIPVSPQDVLRKIHHVDRLLKYAPDAAG